LPSFVVSRLVQTVSWSCVLESAKDHDGAVFLRVQKIMMLVMLVCFVIDEEELQPNLKGKSNIITFILE